MPSVGNRRITYLRAIVRCPLSRGIRRRVEIACVASGLLACPLPAQAQPPATSAGRDSALATVLERLRPRAELRVGMSGFSIEGRLERYAPDTLVLLVSGVDARRLQTASITELLIRRRQTAKGAVVGAVTGGIIFGLLSAAALGAFCEQPSGCKGDYPTVILFGGAAGAGGGALIGAGIGSLTFGWRRIFP
jgi:hypothetical protein